MTHEMTPHEEALQRIIESAQRLGVELDKADALQWLAAMTAGPEADIVVDLESGTFGHRITMLDFSDKDLAHFREMGRLVEFDDVPGQVETALALSGSAAQSKVQTYPGDADFFERVNILARSWQEACRVLGQIMREKALSTRRGPNYQLIQVRMGSYPFDLIRDEELARAGSSITWNPDEIWEGRIAGTTPAGEPVEIAQMACFLLSDRASYVNGQAIAVDGGLSASHPWVFPRS